jgi:hypothetical protein
MGRRVGRRRLGVGAVVLMFFGGSRMSAGNIGRVGADPMTGPDFIFGHIRSYALKPNGDGSLILEDGSAWTVDAKRADFAANSELIRLAMQRGLLLVSGDRARGLVDRVAIPRRLVALLVGETEDGRSAVRFAGPPSIYYVYAERPWARQALALLRDSVERRPPLDQPDLLVSVDVVTAEIMDVRPAT